MSTLKAFSEKERTYHAYQARQNYLREQRSIQHYLETLQAEKEQERAAKEAERAAKEAALQEKEAERQAKDAALQEKRCRPGRDRAAQGSATGPLSTEAAVATAVGSGRPLAG